MRPCPPGGRCRTRPWIEPRLRRGRAAPRRRRTHRTADSTTGQHAESGRRIIAQTWPNVGAPMTRSRSTDRIVRPGVAAGANTPRQGPRREMTHDKNTPSGAAITPSWTASPNKPKPCGSNRSAGSTCNSSHEAPNRRAYAETARTERMGDSLTTLRPTMPGLARLITVAERSPSRRSLPCHPADGCGNGHSEATSSSAM